MTTAVATRNDNKALEVVGEVRRMLNDRDGQLADLLGSGIPIERFKTVALHALNSNPDLWACTTLSIVEAIREAAALRLEPTGLLGDAYLVKYGQNARLMPGYRGLMKLARRSGDVVNIDAQVVYAGDVFDVQLGTDPRVEHVPLIDGERGNFRGAYAWARLATGELVIDWMSYADIEQVRKSSKAATTGPWVGFWSEMARKTVIRRLMKRLPLTTEADRALELEAEAEHEAPKPLPARVSRIHERLGIQAPTVDEASPDQEQAGAEPAAEAESPPASAAVAAQHVDAETGEITEEPATPKDVTPTKATGTTTPGAKSTTPLSSLATSDAEQCASVSKLSGEQCRREAGHGDLHRTTNEAWVTADAR